MLLATLGTGSIVAVGEEGVACSHETLPHSLGLFLRNSSDGAPLLLQSSQFVGSSLPVRAVLQGLSLFAKRDLLFQIG